MTRQGFLTKIEAMLETDVSLGGVERLSDLVNWDSLMVLSFMGLADAECDLQLTADDILQCRTVNDLLALVSNSFVE